MRKYVAITSTLLLTLTSGCLYELRDEFAETRIGWGNKFAASSAWSNSKGLCTGLSCPHSFKEGFMSGYTDVANGGNGCPPAFPIIRCHNHMWMDWCSESEKMEAWYVAQRFRNPASDAVTAQRACSPAAPKPVACCRGWDLQVKSPFVEKVLAWFLFSP